HGAMSTSWEYVLGMKKMTQVGRWDEALALWGEMHKKGLEETPTTYSAAIIAFNVAGKWKQAVETLDLMMLHGMAPIRIGAEHALMACEKGKKWEKALYLIDELWEHGTTPDEDTYMPAIRACENAGMMEIGDKLFWQMREQTKLARVEEEMGMKDTWGGRPNGREPPKAAPAPWRLPGAVALDAYDPPQLRSAMSTPRKRPWKRREGPREPKLTEA
ncbi:unnamed protein product, partial [Polarella glacialis]